MARDIKLNVVYVNKKGVLCEHEGNFTSEETFKQCMARINKEIESLEAFRLFKKKREPQQLTLELT